MVIAQVGMSGTREGCAAPQLRSLRDVLLELVVDGAWELHHGDCVGADAEAHEFWRACRQRVVVHPPTSNAGRALLQGDDHRPRAPHLERNLAIVQQTQILVAAPGTLRPEDDPPSGTWHTVRAALELGRPVVVVRPDGHVVQRSDPQGVLRI